MKTLIVEDSSTLCAIYQAYLDGTGLDVFTVETFSEASEVLHHLKPELILLDIELPDGNGLDLLDQIVAMEPRPAVIVMTGHGVEYAEEAMERGADDFLGKPFDASRLRVTLVNAAEKLQLVQKLDQISTVRTRLGAMLGESPAMQAVYDTIESLATTRATAFILGESGTGKELAARAMHDLSARAPETFVVADCSAIPVDLIESELFGCAAGVRGSAEERTGLIAQADGGTLFLDEVCDLSPEGQSALLRFLQNGSFKPLGGAAEIGADVRIVAATNRDPLLELREGRLREDLFYRLHVIPLRLPALRERGDDVLLLAQAFLQRFASSESRAVQRFSDDARRELRRYPWPGNVRQLENLVHRLVLMASSETIPYDALREAIADSDRGVPLPRPVMASVASAESDGHMVEPLSVTEKRAIQNAIDACDGNINKASGLLEVAPSTIYRKIQSWRSTEEG